MKHIKTIKKGVENIGYHNSNIYSIYREVCVRRTGIDKLYKFEK